MGGLGWQATVQIVGAMVRFRKLLVDCFRESFICDLPLGGLL